MDRTGPRAGDRHLTMAWLPRSARERIGVNGGYGVGVVLDGNTGFSDFDIEGWLVGGQAGYNFVLDGGLAGSDRN